MMFDNESDMMKAFRTHMKKVEAIQALPQYKEFLEYKKELNLWSEFVLTKRLESMKPFIFDLLEDETKMNNYLYRIKKLEERLRLIQQNKGYSFSSSNVMDLLWEYFKKYGDEVGVFDDFGNEAYKIRNYIMEIYSGQGDYGYSINKYNRIF